VFAQFLDAENSSLNGCYASQKDLVNWINTTRADIMAGNQPKTSTSKKR